jgi:K+-transporting ATPase ATPase C chain
MMGWIRALRLYLALTGLLGVAYPLVVTLAAQWLFPHKANGSLIERDGRTIGSALVGQAWERPEYFHGRPSAVDYAGDRSGAAQLAFSSSKFFQTVRQRVKWVSQENGASPQAKVPADLVTSSGSGLDPHISIEAALLQVPRIARARHLPLKEVASLVRKHAEPPQWGILGQWRVNVLVLNLSLDELVHNGKGQQ